MVKSDLIEAVRSRTGQPKQDVVRVVNALFNAIVDSLSLGERVDVYGFGRFETRQAKARQLRHPSNQKLMTIPARNQVVFRVSEGITRIINTPLRHTPSKPITAIGKHS